MLSLLTWRHKRKFAFNGSVLDKPLEMSLLTSVLHYLIITTVFQTYTRAKTTTSLHNIQIKGEN